MKKLIIALFLGLLLSSSITGFSEYKSASSLNTSVVVFSSTDPGNGGVGGGH